MPRIRRVALGAIIIATPGVGLAQGSPCRTADGTVSRGWERYRAGELTAAAQLFARALETCPAHVGAAVGSGYVKLRTGNATDAERHFRNALARDSAVVDAWVGLGVLGWQAGDTAAVRSRFARVQALDPGNPEARRYLDRLATMGTSVVDTAALVANLMRRARESTADGKHPQASALYDSVVQLSPTHRDARFGLAQVLAWDGRYDTAKTVYESLLVRDRGDTDAQKGLARVVAWSGNLDESERRWQAIIQNDPTDGEAHVGLAQVRRWQGRMEAADSALTIAERMRPVDPVVAQERLALRQAWGPTTNPFVTFETDSDGNDMTTLLVAAGMRIDPRIFITGRTVFRSARNTPSGVSDLLSSTVSLDASYFLTPRWTLRAGLGLNTTSSPAPNRPVVRAGVTAPAWNGLTPSVDYRHEPLDVTAALIANGIHFDEFAVSGFGEVAGWSVDGSYGFALVQGSEANPRHLLILQGLREVIRHMTTGTRFRLLSFGKDLNDGYFDPAVYGLLEIPIQWSRRFGSWLVFGEVNPGVQLIDARVSTTDVDVTIGGNARITYTVAPGGDVGIMALYSRSGLQTLSTPGDGYRYFMIGAFGSWSF